MSAFSFFRPRFSIRALLALMTLLALFLAYHLNWIRQRRAAIDSGVVTVRAHVAQPWMQLPRAPRPSRILRLFGEETYAALWVNEKAGDDLAAMAALFPEANLRKRYRRNSPSLSYRRPEIKAVKMANPQRSPSRYGN
ncbi:hypothetical protein [Lacipirellula parvula]|nr:hypothetical protein [Lacipirellula parvula]